MPRVSTGSTGDDDLEPTAAAPSKQNRTKRRRSSTQDRPVEPPVAPVRVRSSFHASSNGPIDASQLPHRAESFPVRASSYYTTYNTNSCSRSHSPFQTAALLNIIFDTDDIIALQEVSDAFYAALLADPRMERYYITSLKDYFKVAGPGRAAKGKAQPKSGEREGVVMIVGRDFLGKGSSVEMYKLECGSGEGGKALVVLKVHSQGIEMLRVASSHFTSLPLNAAVRTRQYTAVESILLVDEAPSTILMADFNNSNQDELLPLASFTDSIMCVRVSKRKDLYSDMPTFGALYPYVEGTFRRKSKTAKRIDRILYRGYLASDGFVDTVHDCCRDGEGEAVTDAEGAEGTMWASDHLPVTMCLKYMTDDANRALGIGDEDEDSLDDEKPR